MTGWVTATGNDQPNNTSNLATESRQGGPIVETSRPVEVNIRNGEMTTTVENPSEYQADSNQDRGTGILATVRDAGNGLIHSRALRETDTVDIGGMRTDIATAISMGFVQRDGQGGYREASPQDAPQATQTEPPEAAPEEFHIGTEGEAAMDMLVTSIDQGSIHSAVTQVIHSGEINDSTIERIAQGIGVEPAEAEALVSQAWHGFYDTSLTRFGHAGVSEEALEGLLNSNPRAASLMKEAAQELFMHNDTAKLDDVRQMAVESLDRLDPAEVTHALTEVGYRYRMANDGQVIVIDRNGGETPWNAAVRSGLIRFL